MKYFSMFSGIGGFELGIGELGDCIGYSEIDKYAIKVYERHFKHENYGNATTINAERLPDFDLLVGGFPCQAFSVAGKRQGFNEMTNQQILEKAISKAIDGGWKPFDLDLMQEKLIPYGDGTIGLHQFYNKLTKSKISNTYGEVSENDVIFNHDFARSLWGEKITGSFDNDGETIRVPVWQHHLKKMVISEDPIKYLGEHIDD